MQIQTVNRTDAEQIFGNFTNKSGGTITKGYAVALATTAASIDGNQAVVAGSPIRTFVGLAADSYANNAVMRVQTYGYCASVYYFAEATSVSVTAGDHAAGPGGAAASLGVGYTGLSVLFGPVVIMESLGAIVRSAGGYIRGFIRAM